MKVFDLLDFTS